MAKVMGLENIDLVKDRPKHDSKQLMNPEDLVVGHKYQKICSKRSGEGCFFKVASKPNIATGQVQVKILPLSGGSYDVCWNLADMGLWPYDGDTWHPTAHIIPVS